MSSKNEKIILKIIKYGPVTTILILSLIISLFAYFNTQSMFNEEKKLIKEDYIETNKEVIRNQVESVYKYIIKKQASTERKLKESLQKRVYEAYNIITNISKNNPDLDKKTLEKLIKDALRTIRFNNERGYFFIYTMDGTNILNAGFPIIEGKNLWNYKDAKGVLLIQEMKKILSTKDETFYDWYWHKPKDLEKKQYKKIGFFKKIESLNWFIGTGEYIDDFEDDVKKEVLEHIHNLTYSKNGYIFVLDFKGNYLNHIRKEIIGLNALEAKDTRSHKTVLDAIEVARNNGSGYKSYIQNRKPGSDLPTVKTSYIRGFEKWEWFIGKGFYEDDIKGIVLRKKIIIEEKFKNNLIQIITVTMVLTLILLLISIKISQLLQKRFKAYKDEIKENLDEITKQHNILSHKTKMAAIGEMIANIAHQWRQPLSTISTAASGLQLKKQMDNLSDNDFNSSLDYIINATQYLSNTIEDFRNFFAKDKKMENFSVRSAFEDTLKIISSQFHNQDIHIIKDIKDIKVYGVKNELIQVLINILNNSRDELVRQNSEKKMIFIDTIEEDGDVLIKIKDNAKGISKDIINHIFEPYFTTKHQTQGTGIGLYMSREIIVKQMKGSIEVSNVEFNYENQSLKGAETTIILKVQKD